MYFIANKRSRWLLMELLIKVLHVLINVTTILVFVLFVGVANVAEMGTKVMDVYKTMDQAKHKHSVCLI